MSKNASDKLAKLASFGKMAGEAPAAAAREAMVAAAAQPASFPTPTADVSGELTTEPLPAQEPVFQFAAISPPKPAGQGTPGPPRIMPPPVNEEANLTRNVVFLPADQIEMDRLEDILRLGGIRKPTLADIVRVALRAANPLPHEAAELFRVAKALDARRKKQ